MAVFINAYQIIILYALIMPNFVCELYFGKAGGVILMSYRTPRNGSSVGLEGRMAWCSDFKSSLLDCNGQTRLGLQLIRD